MDKAAELNVLMLSGWVDQAFTFVRSFSRQKNLNLFVADCWPNSPCGFSRYCKAFHIIPMPEDPGHIPAILAVCAQEKIDIVLPVQHDEVIEVSKNKDLFEEAGIRVPVPDYPLIELANDKFRMARLASEHGILSPQTYLVSETDLAEVKTTIGFPVLTKLRDSTGQRGQKLVRNVEELQGHIDALREEYDPDDIILQEYIPGSVKDTMYTVGMIFNHRRELGACVPLKKIRSRPFTGGTAICTHAETHPKVQDLAIRLMDCLGGWEGIADVEIKMDPRDGEPKFIELNPRPWGSIYGTYAAGVDFPMLWVKVAQREDFEPIAVFEEGIHASFLARDLLLLVDVVGGLFSGKRTELWPVLRSYAQPYLHRNGSSVPNHTSDFAPDDLRPFFKNLHRVRRNFLPKA